MLIAALVVFAFWCAACLVWPLTGSVVPWDSKNHFYPMLRYLGAAIEHGELPLWNPYHFSGHPVGRRSAIASLHADHAAVRLARALAVHAAVRRRGVRAFPAGRLRHPGPVPPARLARGRRRHRRDDLHLGRLRLGPPAAHGHDRQLRVLPARAAFARGGARPPLLPVRRDVRGRRRRHDGGARPGRVPVRADSDRRRGLARRGGRASASSTCASAPACSSPWASPAAPCSPSRCFSPCSS